MNQPGPPPPGFMPNLPMEDEQRKQLQLAFHNTLFFSLLGVCLASIFAVYRMLEMFIWPILWASLVGTVLFPLKRLISDRLKGWLDGLDKDNQPLAIGVTLLPIHIIMQISNFVYETALSFTGLCIALGYFVLKVLCYYGAFTALLNWISRLYALTDALIAVFTQNWIFLLVLTYSFGFGAWIYLQELDKINKKFARVLSLPIWLVLLAHLSDQFGFLRVFMFAFCCTLLGLISAGVIYTDGMIDKEEENDDQSSEKMEEAETGLKEVKKEDTNVGETALQQATTSISDTRLDQALSSDTHLRVVGGLCALLWVVNHDALLLFIFVPFAIAFLVQLSHRIGLNAQLESGLLSAKVFVVENSQKFVHVVVAGSSRKFIHLLFTSDRMFISGLRSRVDLISSICVMCILAIGSLFALLFTVFQLHAETVHLAKLGGNVVASNPDWLRYALNYTGAGGHLSDRDIEHYMEQAYQHGRAWLACNIRQLADPKDPTRADRLEEQAKLLVDNLYQLWEERVQHLYEETMTALENNLTEAGAVQVKRRQSREMDNGENENDGNDGGGPTQWLSRLLHNANMAMWKAELKAVIAQNIETVWTISHSVWHIVLMNISLLSTVLVAILSILVEFSFELLNFLIEWLVFLTVVYYLLASSSDQWLPIKWVNDISNSFHLSQLALPGSSDQEHLNVAKAAEKAIQGVFVLSAKMAIFYGLYTYFVHSLFSLNVIIIPSMLAALLAAIPIIPPYSVALFGVVELYLVRGEPIVAVVFICAKLAPLFFADPVFYRELKGSHPYVTGLAVIGGIYWLGLQGAIIGPIVLCLMLALLNVYGEFAGGAMNHHA